MKHGREQIKMELMKQIEAEGDQLLDWWESAHRPNLTQFENQVLAALFFLAPFSLQNFPYVQLLHPLVSFRRELYRFCAWLDKSTRGLFLSSDFHPWG